MKHKHLTKYSTTNENTIIYEKYFEHDYVHSNTIFECVRIRMPDTNTPSVLRHLVGVAVFPCCPLPPTPPTQYGSADEWWLSRSTGGCGSHTGLVPPGRVCPVTEAQADV